MTLPTLSLIETRILGVLVEKQHTVPDSYPLSLNALTLGCNQKTARDPVINASEGDVLAALDTLKSLHLVLEGSGSRVPRFEQNVARVLRLPGQSRVAGDADAARPADRRRAAPEHRAPASLRRHLVGGGLPRRDGHARAALRGQARARAGRARVALGAPAVRPGGRGRARGPAGRPGHAAGGRGAGDVRGRGDARRTAAHEGRARAAARAGGAAGPRAGCRPGCRRRLDRPPVLVAEQLERV